MTARAPGADQQVRVLIVDDTPDIRMLLRFTLERHPGFVVVGEAGNGHEAHARAREQPPDLVLLDLAMPVMDGLAALPGLRRIAPAATIIVLSGFEADRMAQRALAAGADGYLQKGAPPAQIVEYLHTVLPARGEAAATSPGARPATSEDDTAGAAAPGAVAQLADEVARLRQALATVAHEIRNPVMVLRGVADILEQDGFDESPERRAQLLGTISRQARVLERITGDILGAAQSHRGKLEVRVEPVRLADVIPISTQTVPTAEAVEIIGSAEVMVMADPVRLQQVLANLLSNAVKYGCPPISIRIEPTHQLVRISVEDRGKGVPPDFRPRLFTEFSRAPESTGSGTGLGLYVVRSLVEAQGGVVDYDDHPESGAVFTVTLPKAS